MVPKRAKRLIYLWGGIKRHKKEGTSSYEKKSSKLSNIDVSFEVENFVEMKIGIPNNILLQEEWSPGAYAQ